MRVKVNTENFYFIEGRRIRITTKEYFEEAEKLGAIHGVAVFRKGNVVNPTSSFVLIFGHIAKNRVKLDLKELKDFLERGEIKKKINNYGYFLVEFDRKAIALGFYKNEKLKCLMSKEMRNQLLEALKLKRSLRQNPPQ